MKTEINLDIPHFLNWYFLILESMGYFSSKKRITVKLAFVCFTVANNLNV